MNAVYGSNGIVQYIKKSYEKCVIVYPSYHPSKEFHSLRAENHWFFHWRGSQIMDKDYWPVKSGPLREGNPYIVKKFFIDTTLILDENEIVKNRTEFKNVASATNVAAVTISTLPSIQNTNYFTAEKNELEKWGNKVKDTVKNVFQEIVAAFNF